MTFSLDDIFISETLVKLKNESKYKIREIKVAFKLINDLIERNVTNLEKFHFTLLVPDCFIFQTMNCIHYNQTISSTIKEKLE